MAKEVQKRWRSIRDSYTKAFRQGKCPPPEQCAPGSRRYQYHRQMAFLLRALKNKKPRYSQDKYDSFSEMSNSPQHPPPDDIPRIRHDVDKPLDLQKKPDKPKAETPEKPKNRDKFSQVTMDTDKTLEIKIDANSILPDDHFDDDKSFMNSLIPLFKKMNDDTRLLCRIEVLKIIRYALQGNNKSFEALRMAEDSFFKNRISGVRAKEEAAETARGRDSKLAMTTRSADGSRPIRKRRHSGTHLVVESQEDDEDLKILYENHSPSPSPVIPKKRGPGRPRKVRPPPSDSDSEPARRALADDDYGRATSVAQLSAPLFMKMYNLERAKTSCAPVKLEPPEPAAP